MAVSDEIKPVSGINVTSLVDITMSLLIMFMITIPILHEQKVRSAVNIPILEDSSYSEVISEDQEHAVIAIDKNGLYLWSIVRGEEVSDIDTINSVEDLLPHLRTLNQISVVSIEADSLVSYKYVIDCVRIVAKAGINNVDLVYTTK